MLFETLASLLPGRFGLGVTRLKSEDAVYLTFDDGPHPVATPRTLELLGKHCLTGTFFCLGEQLERHSKIAATTLSEGHALANHSYDHTSFLRKNNTEILQSLEKTRTLLAAMNSASSHIYRPPYGRITKRQAGTLSDEGYRLCMWSVMPGDYRKKRSVEDMLGFIRKRLQPGDIIVLHDNENTAQELPDMISGLADILDEKGLRSARITDEELSNDG